MLHQHLVQVQKRLCNSPDSASPAGGLHLIKYYVLSRISTTYNNTVKIPFVHGTAHNIQLATATHLSLIRLELEEPVRKKIYFVATTAPGATATIFLEVLQLLLQ